MKNGRQWANIIPYLIVIVALYSIMNMGSGLTTKRLNYTEFEKFVQTEKIEKAELTISTVVIDIEGTYTDNGTEGVSFTARVPNTEKISEELIQTLEDKEVSITIVSAYQTNVVMDIVTNVLPFLVFGGFAMFLVTRMGGNSNNSAFEFSKSRARLEKDIRVRFDDVAGCDEEKEEMEELIEYLKNPKKFAKMGARIPKGILLVGPPGTGAIYISPCVLSTVTSTPTSCKLLCAFGPCPVNV
mgnify:CR=1 FL=1